jgi:formylmethanofuran dehydrogenase subunit D
MQEGDKWRIVRRGKHHYVGCGMLQPMVQRGSVFIPLGPWAESIDEMRRELTAMLAACDEPIIDGSEVHTV